MTQDRLAMPEGLDVSREASDMLEAFVRRVQKWNQAINLVSTEAPVSLWNRHVVDSAQLFLHAPQDARLWVDLGSGGGFPGLVIAILARTLRPELAVVLVESDQRKAAFLRLTSAELSLPARVLAARIENCAPFCADVLSARALAPLDRLCHHAQAHLSASGTALFPKGARFEAEVAVARTHWTFDLQTVPSLTDDHAMILKIKDIRRA